MNLGDSADMDLSNSPKSTGPPSPIPLLQQPPTWQGMLGSGSLYDYECSSGTQPSESSRFSMIPYFGGLIPYFGPSAPTFPPRPPYPHFCSSIPTSSSSNLNLNVPKKPTPSVITLESGNVLSLAVDSGKGSSSNETNLRDTKPSKCRTIFVAGVPDMCTEDHLREIFARCGDIESVRMRPDKNYAHIKFTSADALPAAICYSGCRLRVAGRGDKEHCGRLYVDFALNRAQMKVFEGQGRNYFRRSPSPDINLEKEIPAVLERLKSVETFTDGTETLAFWLERGDYCTKKTSAQIYNMAGVINSHIRRLMAEKFQATTEMSACTQKFRETLQSVMSQLEAIERVFMAARKQRNWDQFSKPQRKNLEMWLRTVEQLKMRHEMDMLRDRHEVEMDTSDDEHQVSTSTSTVQQPKVAEVIQHEKSVSLSRSTDCTQLPSVAPVLENTQSCVEATLQDILNEVHPREPPQPPNLVSEKETRLLCLVAIFLQVHPYGARVCEIRDYLDKASHSVKVEDLESLLRRLPSVFRAEEDSSAQNLEKKWKFIGFDAS